MVWTSVPPSSGLSGGRGGGSGGSGGCPGGSGGDLKEVLTVNFINAYPKAIGAVQLSSENRNAFTTFQVEFNYESYTTDHS